MVVKQIIFGCYGHFIINIEEKKILFQLYIYSLV